MSENNGMNSNVQSPSLSSELLSENMSRLTSELTCNPNGSILLEIDIQKRILRWKDSNMWNRNFSRSISMLEIDELRKLIRESNLRNWPKIIEADCVEDRLINSSFWSLKLFDTEGEEIFSYFSGDFNKAFILKFCDGLSLLARQHFRVT